MNNMPLTAQKGVSPPDTPGRNTLRQLVSWGKIPVLRIGRKSIIRTDLLDRFMEINQGRNLLDCNQVRHME